MVFCVYVCTQKNREDDMFCGVRFSLGSSMNSYLLKAGYRKVLVHPFWAGNDSARSVQQKARKQCQSLFEP